MQGDSFFQPGTVRTPKCELCGKHMVPGDAVEWTRESGILAHAGGWCATGGHDPSQPRPTLTRVPRDD